MLQAMRYSIRQSLKFLMLLAFSLVLVLFTKIHSPQSQPRQTRSPQTPVPVNIPESTPKAKSNDGLKTLELPSWMYWGKVENGTEGHNPPPYHIGVLSSSKYLHSRAIDLYHTWGKEAHSIAFYTGYSTQAPPANLPVTVLKDTNDTAYPPQQKGFRLLQHWCQNLLDQYAWFVKVDDDCYVKVAYLEQFLTGLDETIEYYIGRSGSGLQHEKHLLGLYGNTFCCGPTVVYSRAILKGVCEHLDTCLGEVVTKHEDTEVGRCMISKMGQQCSKSHKNVLSKLFFQTYNKEYYKGDLSTNKHFMDAISVHEVKSSQDMYNLHFYYRQTLASPNNTIPYSRPKSNPLRIRQSKASVPAEMCHNVKCTHHVK